MSGLIVGRFSGVPLWPDLGDPGGCSPEKINSGGRHLRLLLLRLSRGGGAIMQGRVLAGIVFVSLLTVAGGVAQSPTRNEKPVWTLEVVKVKPGMFGLALGYLDDDWMRVRGEAKHQGPVLSYHRIGEQGGPQSDGNIILLTEYKNQATYDGREKLFESIRKQLPKNSSSVVRAQQPEDLYDIVSTRLFQDFSDMDNARFRLLAAN
jgi:hypothetical protein